MCVSLAVVQNEACACGSYADGEDVDEGAPCVRITDATTRLGMTFSCCCNLTADCITAGHYYCVRQSPSSLHPGPKVPFYLLLAAASSFTPYLPAARIRMPDSGVHCVYLLEISDKVQDRGSGGEIWG